MDNFQIRTDLALEARESVNEEESKLRGVSVEEHYEEEADLRITKVTIDTKNAEKMLGKPMGVYVTMEAPAMVEPDDDYHREISEALAEELLKMMPQEQEEQSVLVVGLGNREVTADALGPQVIDNLLITRHVVKNYGKAAYNCTRMNLVSSIEPGVMAKTGMETAEIISGVVKETGPDVLIVVDALAARSTRRLNRTIQITNTGIQPGSGVGNHRNALTQETLGVPVIAIGIPTVVDAATIVGDALEKLMSGEKEFDANGKEIWDTHYNEWNSNVGYRKDSQNVVLSAGKYYMQINGYAWGKSYKSTGKYVFSVSSLSQANCNHDYSSKWVDATYFEKGYRLYTCEKCGKKYKDDYVAKRQLDQGSISSWYSSGGKGKIYLRWYTISDASGYQIRYCKKKSMKSGVKVMTVKGQRKYKKTISKLSRRKRYYVQVRAYKKSGKKTVYGKWSKKYMLKTK